VPSVIRLLASNPSLISPSCRCIHSRP
jgi:hypothetical protein